VSVTYPLYWQREFIITLIVGLGTRNRDITQYFPERESSFAGFEVLTAVNMRAITSSQF
jgi:hypothetical protein